MYYAAHYDLASTSYKPLWAAATAIMQTFRKILQLCYFCSQLVLQLPLNALQQSAGEYHNKLITVITARSKPKLAELPERPKHWYLAGDASILPGNGRDQAKAIYLIFTAGK